MPKVSVLMPIYKTKEKYLREAIESILKQTFEDFEFLILDDCPDDSREEIVKSYKDKRIKYSKNAKNLGITPSRNKLIEMAKGEYLAIMDHDDISLPTRFEKQVKYLDEHKDIGVVGSYVKFMIKNKLLKNPINDAEIRLALMGGCVITHPSSMIRKSVLIENNIRYEEVFSPAEDYALWCRLIPFTKFHNLDEVLFHYRDHAENTSHKQEDKMWQKTLEIWSLFRAKEDILYNTFLLKTTQKIDIRLFGLIPIISITKYKNRMKIYFMGILLLKFRTRLVYQER